jgi:hypothetical protein
VKVRILESINGYTKGEHDLPKNIAIDLISKGYAVVVKEKEKATDKDAENVLLSAKLRDGAKE